MDIELWTTHLPLNRLYDKLQIWFSYSLSPPRLLPTVRRPPPTPNPTRRQYSYWYKNSKIIDGEVLMILKRIITQS